MYEYTKIDYTHPNPRLRSRREVTVHVDVAGVELVTGQSVDVGDVYA